MRDDQRFNFGALVGALVAFAVLTWCAYAWTRTTGLTFASRRHRGRIATAADVRHARNTAVGGTIAAGVAVTLYVALGQGKR